MPMPQGCPLSRTPSPHCTAENDTAQADLGPAQAVGCGSAPRTCPQATLCAWPLCTAKVCLTPGRKPLGLCPGHSKSAASILAGDSYLHPRASLTGAPQDVSMRRKRAWRKWVRINPGHCCQDRPLLADRGSSHLAHFSSGALVPAFACLLESRPTTLPFLAQPCHDLEYLPSLPEPQLPF